LEKRTGKDFVAVAIVQRKFLLQKLAAVTYQGHLALDHREIFACHSKPVVSIDERA